MGVNIKGGGAEGERKRDSDTEIWGQEAERKETQTSELHPSARGEEGDAGSLRF